MSTLITATITDDTIKLIGPAAYRGTASGYFEMAVYVSYNRVTRYSDPDFPFVAFDNDQEVDGSILIPEIITNLVNFDFRELERAGVDFMLYTNDTVSFKALGSEQDDRIFVYGDHVTNDRLKGMGGDDVIFGGKGNDRLYGGTGADKLGGGDGNDFLFGGKGSDRDFMDGGNGTDTVVLLGARDEYIIESVNSIYRVSHVGGSGEDGIDFITDVEFLRFTDQTIALLPAPDMTTTIDGMTLTMSGQIDDEYRMYVAWDGQSFKAQDVAYLPHGGHYSDISVTLASFDTDASFRKLDFKGITGRGVSLSFGFDVPWATKVIGSEQGDSFTFDRESTADLIISGLDGYDGIRTGAGNDILRGGRGWDWLDGGAGNDTLSGGIGRDTDSIDGGDGTDTLLLTGARDEYEIDIVDGLYQISHVGGTKTDGVDWVANVELLQFTDQTITLPTSTEVVASVTGNTLSLSGQAASPWYMLKVEQSGDTFDIYEDLRLDVLVSVTGALQTARNIDASAVTGGGVTITSESTSTTGRTLIGTDQSDRIYAEGHQDTDDLIKGLGGDDSIEGGNGNDTLRGGKGNDRLFGEAGDDSLHGGFGNDSLNGGFGDDLLIGGYGDDTLRGSDGNDILMGIKGANTFEGGAGDDVMIGGKGRYDIEDFDGGDGVDTIVFSGNRDEYEVTLDGTIYRIVHLGGDRSDGVNLVENVEFAQFTDQTVAEADWLLI